MAAAPAAASIPPSALREMGVEGFGQQPVIYTGVPAEALQTCLQRAGKAWAQRGGDLTLPVALHAAPGKEALTGCMVAKERRYWRIDKLSAELIYGVATGEDLDLFGKAIHCSFENIKAILNAFVALKSLSRADLETYEGLCKKFKLKLVHPDDHPAECALPCPHDYLMEALDGTTK